MKNHNGVRCRKSLAGSATKRQRGGEDAPVVAVNQLTTQYVHPTKQAKDDYVTEG